MFKNIKNFILNRNDQGAYALILTPEGNVLLQQRETKPDIKNSGKIAMFGGATENNEALINGLRRELFEELELNIDEYKIEKFGVYQKTKKLDGMNHCVNVWLVYDVDQSKLILHEGETIISDKPKNLINNPKLTRVTKLALQDLINKKS